MSETFYFKKDSTSDIYMGTGAGADLMKEIEHAETSIKIISPYLSPSYVEKLIQLKKSGKEISFITSDSIEDFHDNRNLKQLIIQNRATIEKAKAEPIYLYPLETGCLFLPFLFLSYSF
jgi:phosphatidylserine/phosphatidylglycerophosphate/cardiolipin synthase-like enzyme